MNKTVKLKVNNDDFEIHFGEMLSGDIPHNLAWLSSLLADAKLDLSRSEALYRNWRAVSTNMISDKHPKWAEWRINAAINGEDMFLKYKEGIVVQQHAVDCLRWICEAVRSAVGLHQGPFIDNAVPDKG